MEGKIENIASHPRVAGGKWWNPFNHEYIDFIHLTSTKCKDFHLEFLRCSSRVGLQNAESKCKEQFDDVQECSLNRKRVNINFSSCEL